MIEWSLEAFRACEAVRSIVVAAPPGHAHDLGGEGAGDEPGLSVLDGGVTRAESVANALAAVATDLVAIHDAARPLLTPALVAALVARLVEEPAAAGVIAATPVTDTIKRAGGTKAALFSSGMENAYLVVGETVDRSQLWAAQTPQLFRTDRLREALASSQGPEEVTDEAMLVERAGGKVLIHPTGPENLKVTTPLDLRVAEVLLADRSAAQQ
jgi:2-C-methyl-D-erythritol 4-phosphate cytidylyltransferase